jgi:hypothetical protein
MSIAGAPRLLVLVTGAARSGTSTAAGTLHHLGLEVPGPFMAANESNPKGFYESRWSVRFHNELIREAGVNVVDGRPEARERIRAAVDDRARRRVARYLERHHDLDQLVVKDPRTVWTQYLWADAARDAGREIRYLSMLRHPAEVVGSRNTYYADHSRAAGATEPQQQASLNLMRWINTTLVSERATRGARRSFVEYADLLVDWRPVMSRVGVELGLRFDPPTAVTPHPVDDFIDPALRRHAPSWDAVPAPASLQDVAQRVWDLHGRLVHGAGADETAQDGLDVVADDYRRLVEEAALLDQEAQHEAVRRARAAAPTVASRPVEEFRSRELLRIIGRRAVGRGRR